VKENSVRRHVTELGVQADLGAKPKSVQPISREAAGAKEQSGENPVLKHVQELQRQAEPVYPKERIEEARKKWPDMTLDMIIWRLKDKDQRAEDRKHGRRRGFSFF
jgi:hypothetical protein